MPSPVNPGSPEQFRRLEVPHTPYSLVYTVDDDKREVKVVGLVSLPSGPDHLREAKIAEHLPSLEEYAYRFSQTAERRKIPPELRVSLFEILEDFSQLLTQFPGRIKPHEQSPGQFIYCHPDPPLEITYQLDEIKKEITFVTYAAPLFGAENG